MMSLYAWIIWLITVLAAIIMQANEVFHIHNLHLPKEPDFAYQVLLFMPVLIYITKSIYGEESLKDLFLSSNSEQHPFVQLFTPHIFTSTVFLILAIMGYTHPYGSDITQSIYLYLGMLGAISLFNLMYQTINNIYYHLIQKDFIENMEKVQTEEQKHNED